MKIRLKKLSHEQHQMEIVRSNGESEIALCHTRSFLKHDLLHYAVEQESASNRGFWGLLAEGKTLEDLNDRTGESIADLSEQIMTIEAVVGVLHNISQLESFSLFLDNLASQGEGLGWTIPDWLTEDLLVRVKEKMRRLMGHWQSIQYGETLELEW